MELDKSLIKEFVQATNDSETKPQNTYLRGTVIKNSGGKYVQLDGSTTATPISEIVDVEEGDRVLVSIENHKATIIGNFSFPPSARKEQEAIDKAEAAQGTANGAGEAANLAQEKAQEASNKADTAIEQSSIASASADEAKQQATDAINTANTASTNASEAKSLAAGASSDASEAKTLASQSQAASANAQAEVTRLQGEVNAAKEDAADAIEELNKQAGEIEAIKENYSTKVDLGNTKTELETEISKKVGELQTTIGQTYSTKTENVELEGRLQSQITQTAEGLASQVTKIEKIEADTTEAQKDVEEALTKVNAANTAASEAQSKADAAQAAANTAASNAQSAVDKATIAQNAADAATAAANAADQAVQSAQSDLNEAKQNLANVTSRVDATEADIAEAQGKVDAAQTAVNNALADAAEANLAANKAQEAADKAQQDAETAQGAANTAQTKADNAQTAANNAQAAADKAQADVAALTSRVTSAETKITQNSEQIALTATKTEEIGTKFDNLEIGGRNIIQNSGNFEVKEPWFPNGTGGSLEVIEYENKKCLHAINSIVQTSVSYQLEFDTDYVYHTYIKFVEGCTMTNQNPLHYWIWAYDSVTNSRPSDYTGAVKVFSEWYVDTPGNKSVLPNTWHHLVLKFTTKTQEATGKQYVMFKPFLYGYSATGEYWIQWIKLEKGNKPTDWSPAPEDARNDLNNSLTNYYSKTETDAKLQVESDRITSAVSKISTVETNFNNLTIGGRNILLNSSFRENGNKWVIPSDLRFVELDGKKCAHIQQTSFGIIKTTRQSILGKLEPNTTYTVSGWVRTDNIVKGPTNPDIMFYYDGSYDKDGVSTWFGYGGVQFKANTGEGSWQYLTKTFTTDNKLKTATRYDFLVYTRDITGDVYFYDVKLEKGNKPTDWTPAPEDAESEIDSINNNLINNYYTKTQTDAKVQIESDRITSAVSKIETVETNFNNLEIGGRNLILESDKWRANGNVSAGITQSVENDVLKVVSTSGNGNWMTFAKKNVIEENLKEGDAFTFSMEIKSDDGTKPPRIYFKNGLGYYDMKGTVSTEYSTVYYTGTWKDANDITFHFGWSQAIGTYYIRKVKMEKGNKPTDWTPAPEVIENNLANNYYTKTQTDAKFEIESDRITSTVTKIEETQEELDNLTISGRNMLLNSELAYPYTGTDYTSNTAYDDKTAVSKSTNKKGNAYCSVLNQFAIPINELLTKTDDEFTFSLDASISGSFKNLRFDLDTRIPRTQSYYFNPVIKIPDDCSKNEWIRVSGIGKIEKAKQLYNFEDINQKTNGVTADNDGWITVEYDNTTGTSTIYCDYYTNNLDLKTSTNYNLFVEISNITGSFITYFCSSQATSQIATQLYKLTNQLTLGVSNFTIKTKDSFDGTTRGLRTTFGFNAGQSGSITFRISVIEDLTVTPETFVYQPYVGSTLRQLYNYEDTATVTEGITVEDGWISVSYDNSEGKTEKLFKYYTNNLDLQTSTKYALFYEIKEVTGTGWLYTYDYNSQSAYTGNARLEELLSGVKKYEITTDADFASATIPGIGTYVRFAPGQSGTITFRISVYDDLTMTPENFVYAPYGESPDSSFLRVSWDGASSGALASYRYPKLEEGNRPTAWTPAPEDVSDVISKVEDNVTNRLDEVSTSIEKAQSTIDQLSNMISHLVTDNNGGSLMTQTPDGWTFNMSNVTDNLTAIKDAMVNMENDQNGTNDALNKLSDLVNDVANKTAYITMSMDDNGDPCIELGKADNPFKVRITNTAIDFLEGSTKIAYANNNTFYSEKIIVKNELQIGEGPGFVWRTRANGNMGLVYISG